MSSVETRQYDPLQVVGSWTTPGTFGVVDIMDGTIDGEFAAVARDNPRFAREHDRAGNTTRVKNNNRGGTVTITLSASSPTNETLANVQELDDLTETQVGVLLLKDLNGNTVIEADGAFLQDQPDPTFGAERGTRAWIFECSAIRVHNGGHRLTSE